MRDATAYALNRINRSFYRDHASEFERTRRRAWPGWWRVLAHLHALDGASLRLLDVGCGSGRFGVFLAQHLRRPLVYCGVDASASLLAAARSALADAATSWIRADLLEEPAGSALPAERWDAIAAFGVLHHIPGEARRRALLEELVGRLAPGGLLALTFWDFGREARFERRRVGWESAAIDPDDLEPGDALLRWGAPGTEALRYCHHTDDAEEQRLLAGLPVVRCDAYAADGASSRLNRYRILRAQPQPSGRSS